MTILMVWQEGSTLAARFAGAWQTLSDLLGHQRQIGRTYQGYVRAWVRHSPRLLALIQPHLRMLIRTMAAASWMTAPASNAPESHAGSWVLFGCDGSRVDTPRTAANERAFGCGGRAKTTPQLWLTTIMHLVTGLPWCWTVGKADADERTHLRRMVRLLPLEALLIADAGYTGYDLWRTLIDSGRSILIRVGANVRLLTKLGYAVREYDGLVYLWPDQQRKLGRTPLVLRLIRLHDGRKEVCLITNVLDGDRRTFSDQQAAQWYRLRWGLELFFRAMKQTMRRRKLQSHAPVQAVLELRWTMVGMTCLGLLQIRALVQSGIEPHRASVAGALRVLRAAMRRLTRRLRRGQTLAQRLADAVVDEYRREGPKAARVWPHRKKDSPPGCPQCRPATATQVKAAQRLRRRKAA